MHSTYLEAGREFLGRIYVSSRHAINHLRGACIIYSHDMWSHMQQKNGGVLEL